MELERARWVHRRFLWMVGISLAISVPVLPLLWIAVPEADSTMFYTRDAHLVRSWWATLTVVLYVAATVVVLVRRKTIASARFTSMLALALITFIAALSVPIERFAAGLEGTFSLEQMAEQDRASTRSSAGDSMAAFRSGLEAGLRSNPRESSTGSQPSTRVAASGVEAEGSQRVTLRRGVLLEVETSGGGTTRATTGPATGPARTTGAARPNEMNEVMSSLFRSVLTPGVRTGIYGIYIVFVTHLISCIFMPWTVRESLVPGVGALGGYSMVLAADLLSGQVGMVFAVTTWMCVAAMLVPGTTLCWWRYSRFRGEYRLKFESGRYKELRGELASARRIHESCLPAQLGSGPVRLHYAYRPMSDIGGDLLVCRKLGSQADADVLVGIVDVTGHGIAAALTVNRLLGELDRVIGSTREPQPGVVLSALNRYTRLMLSHHSLYLSACVIRLEPRTRTVRFASGGHPTVYRLRLGETTSPAGDLESTATLLGILPPEEFDAGEVSVVLEPGEVLVACTDGATETRTATGELLRTAGLREIVQDVVRGRAVPLSGMADGVLKRLDAIRPGDAEDDTLLVVMGFA